MASSLLHPPAHLPPSVAVQLSQQAPLLLQNAPSSITSTSVGSLLAPTESADLWTIHENLMLSCLRTGDEQSARLCLERLTDRFGESNERLMALRGLYQEAIAEDDKALQKVLEGYEETLANDPTNMPVTKRRIALLKTMGKPTEAIHGLTKFLDVSPTDAEAWAELSDLYVSQGLYSQAIFTLEEVLLITPNAWNIHAKLGELQYQVAAGSGNDGSPERTSAAEALRRFCRSIELCDDYLRGYYGLKLTTNLILKSLSGSPKNGEAQVLPDIRTVEQLNQRATAKLTEIVRRSNSGEAGWGGYGRAELIAAQELLGRDAAPVTR